MKVQLTIYLENSLLNKLTDKAKEQHRTISNLITVILLSYLEANEEK